nr:copia protein [Tanacetum cinerariifolium]
MNKKDKRGIVVRNKARLVAQGHKQEEGIDYDEVFAHVAMIEAIKIFLAFASFMGFNVYQMDVKSAFLYGTIEEEAFGIIEILHLTWKPIWIDYAGANHDRKSTTKEYVTVANCCGQFVTAVRRILRLLVLFETWFLLLGVIFRIMLHGGYFEYWKAGLVVVVYVNSLFATILAQPAVVEGEGLRNPPESQPTPSPTQPINESQIPESSSSPKNTQSPRQTLEGTSFPHTRGPNFPDLRLDVEAVHKEGSIEPPLSTGYTVRSREDKMDHDIELTDPAPQTPYDSPLSGGFHPFRAGASKRNSLGRRKVSNQGRKNLKTQQMFQDNVLDEDADTEMIVEHKGNGEKGGSTAKTVSTARPHISAARPKMKNQKAKEKGIAFKVADDSARPIRSITTLQPFPTINPKDKGKGILQEFELVKKTKKKNQDQIERDAKVALKIQAHLNKDIDIDHELAVRLTMEEQEKYIVKERSKLFAEFFERRKKQLAKERAEAIRSKPPTKNQLRNLMMTYLKNTCRFTYDQLKSGSFKEIQKLYIKEKKWVDAFVPIGSEEDKKRTGSRKKRAAGSSSKHKSPKKQKVNDQDSEDNDKEHKKCLKVVPDDDKVIGYETLDVKSSIVDCESQVLRINKGGDVHVYILTRIDGSYRHFSTFSRMLEVLDRQDVLDLHKIIMERFPANDPEGYDLIL